MQRLTIILIVLLFFSYQQSTDTNTVLNKKDSIPIKNSIKINYIVFGIYYGECGEHCAIMFRYNMRGNANTLLADYTDSYFKNKHEIKFATVINDRKKFLLASDIVKHIPEILMTAAKQEESFGCPDCTDGGGIYFEIATEKGNKKFFIDAITSKLNGDIKSFAEYLIPTIDEMKKNTP